MELNARPLLYGSRHPFYFVAQNGELLFSEFENAGNGQLADQNQPTDQVRFLTVVVGKCCESGDSQCLDAAGLAAPRSLPEPEIGDYAVIGGAGAYCSAMSPFNYNSHAQAPEILFTRDSTLVEIRARQTIEQMLANEK